MVQSFAAFIDGLDVIYFLGQRCDATVAAGSAERFKVELSVPYQLPVPTVPTLMRCTTLFLLLPVSLCLVPIASS